jgi:hypothetical protein
MGPPSVWRAGFVGDSTNTTITYSRSLKKLEVNILSAVLLNYSTVCQLLLTFLLLIEAAWFVFNSESCFVIFYDATEVGGPHQRR